MGRPGQNFRREGSIDNMKTLPKVFRRVSLLKILCISKNARMGRRPVRICSYRAFAPVRCYTIRLRHFNFSIITDGASFVALQLVRENKPEQSSEEYNLN